MRVATHVGSATLAQPLLAGTETRIELQHRHLTDMFEHR
jgi:hypothetical protein